MKKRIRRNKRHDEFNANQTLRFINKPLIEVLNQLDNKSVNLIFVNYPEYLSEEIKNELNRIKKINGSIYFNYARKATIGDIEDIVVKYSSTNDILLDVDCIDAIFSFVGSYHRRKVIAVNKNDTLLKTIRENVRYNSKSH